MGIFDRMSRMIKSNVNSKIDKHRDPAKELEQIVLDLEAELKKNQAETAEIMATEKRITARLPMLEKQIQLWGERAEAAVRAGDDELAKEALIRRGQAEETLVEAKEESVEAKKYALQMQEALKANHAKLREIKMKKGAIRARVATSKNVEVSAEALDEFERVAGKVDDSEAEVEANDELAELTHESARDAQVEEKFRAMEKKGAAGSAVDDRLAALKRRMAPPPEKKQLGDGSKEPTE
jgi:phage shock protein A